MGWLINTIVTLLIGAVLIPFLGFAAGPVFGLATVTALDDAWMSLQRRKSGP